MKVEELRVGNLIYSTMYLKYFVVDVDLDFFYDLLKESISIKNFAPIPFTNEWLDRFGFEKRDNSNWWHKGNFTYWQDQNTWYWRMEAINPDLTRYVHQIQNLYYSLTGEEL